MQMAGEGVPMPCRKGQRKARMQPPRTKRDVEKLSKGGRGWGGRSRPPFGTAPTDQDRELMPLLGKTPFGRGGLGVPSGFFPSGKG